MRMSVVRRCITAATTILLWQTAIILTTTTTGVHAKLADRARIVKARQDAGKTGRFHDNGLPIEGPSYRSRKAQVEREVQSVMTAKKPSQNNNKNDKDPQQTQQDKGPVWKMEFPTTENANNNNNKRQDKNPRKLSSQLSGCCYDYQSYGAEDLCAMYGQDCESGETPSHDSGDGDCSQDGLSFIGISFSVNTANGNPYSYQLCDQLPMENIIDRDYEYVMSMDEDGWLVGGGYKTFDYSGKMPYIDSSHTELLRIGNMNPDAGGTSISQVYSAMDSLSFPPFSIFPEYLKGGGGGHSGDNGDEGGAVPSGDITLIVSVVETYEDNDSYSAYEQFMEDLFDAMDAVGGGPCMDDHDTDPHVSMSRGVKFWSASHAQQYMYNANLEVAVWQSMYPNGVVIGSSGYASFPPDKRTTRQYVGYGNLYFFFDRANITTAFAPNRGLSSDEEYYSILFTSGDVSSFYSATSDVDFDYSGSHDDGDSDYEHNPYNWRAQMALHDMTDGWDLPPNCLQEGETFFGIPLSRKSQSKFTGTATFQEQFDFEMLVDRNGTYVNSFGTNHGWLVGEELDNPVGSIVDKDTAHIPVFYTGTTNPDMGGMSLADMIKIGKEIDFGRLYIKPAFVFVDGNGHVKLQFEADSNSALAYLYDNLCKELGIAWNYDSPYNQLGVYTNCAMHAAGDRATYGCGPDNSNSGGFCPQMTLAYGPRFSSEDHAAAYLARCNNYVDYWRSLYPSGVAVGTNQFCPDGGCLGLFLNRYDLFEVFLPDLGGSWVEYNDGSRAPTISPAPTFEGGCSDPRNALLDRCFRPPRHKGGPRLQSQAWQALGSVGRFSLVLISFMAVTLAISMFIARARRKKKRGETYLQYLARDFSSRGKKRKKKRGRPKTTRGAELAEGMLEGSRRSASRSRRSRSKSKSRGGSSMRSGRSSRSRSASRKQRRKEVLDLTEGTANDNRQQLV